MIIVETYPPNIEAIRKAIKLDGFSKGVVYAYGNVLYNPQKISISPDLMAHEEVHEIQQGDDPEAWWEEYLADTQFRLEQEVEAYIVQLKYVKEHYGRDTRRQVFEAICNILSGRLYGNVISKEEAKKLLIEYR